jgi:hypothetical protein
MIIRYWWDLAAVSKASFACECESDLVVLLHALCSAHSGDQVHAYCSRAGVV